MPLFRRSNSVDGSRNIFRRRRKDDSETWAEFHKKYQSDVYRRSANSNSVGKRDNKNLRRGRKISVANNHNQNFISKIMEPASPRPKVSAPPKIAGRRRAVRRASAVF
jgi:hypothetical protein